MTDQTELTLADEAAILEVFVRNQLEIKRLTEENETIKGYYKQEAVNVDDTDPYDYRKREVGKFYVQTSPNTRFDESEFKRLYPERDFPEYYKPVPDTTYIKKVFTPESYATFQRVFTPKVSIDLV